MAAAGEARLLALGAVLQAVAQASGLLVLLVIITLLARRLSVAELGAYWLAFFALVLGAPADPGTRPRRTSTLRSSTRSAGAAWSRAEIMHASRSRPEEAARVVVDDGLEQNRP
jgi:hypothetical protein